MLAFPYRCKMALRKVVRVVSDKLLLGTCLPCVHDKTTKILVPILELNEYLLAYFGKKLIYYAWDPKNICNSGDLVLIRKLAESRENNITHEVVEVAYPLGDVTDPVTGEKCAGSVARSFMERECELYGKSDSGFNFANAPKRGWQEGKRDFTNKETYIKYHEFNEDEEEFNDPYAL